MTVYETQKKNKFVEGKADKKILNKNFTKHTRKS